jgi:formylglycine-generating enzyme required for sulfatase activity
VSSGDARAGHSSESRSSHWAVPLAALTLVAASWAALYLASSPASLARDSGGGASDAVELPEQVSGFRSDAWFLPDEALLGFVEIPAGPFTMGSDPSVDPLAFEIERWSASAPTGIVDLPAYYIARYEVTVAQYAAFVRATGHRVADPSALRGDPRLPVTGVAWTDAVAYARWLGSALAAWEGTPPELGRRFAQGWQVRLPTEAEWEKAARGSDGRVWPWGSEPRRDRANFGTRGPVPVGSIACPECPYGLADMAGNVWEWTRSPYQAYPFGASRVDLEAEALWVMRGGAFSDAEQNVRAAVRGGADPGARRPFIGFRVVLDGA